VPGYQEEAALGVGNSTGLCRLGPNDLDVDPLKAVARPESAFSAVKQMEQSVQEQKLRSGKDAECDRWHKLIQPCRHRIN
jgi:hypothetical protein